ncbi:protein rolling stone-like [Tubulanus polymorphus]|uniref:protein rolling stone-like n=1 Tax=Tubulanus polymorphus TaxID=672921 RepID=UPI003DA645C1
MGSCKTVLKDEFTLKALSLTYTPESDFYYSQSGCHPAVFLVLRTALCVYQLSAFIYSVSTDPYKMGATQEHFFLAFLTRWAFTTLTIYVTIALIVSIVGHLKLNRQRKLEVGALETEYDPVKLSNPWYTKVVWILYIITVPAAFFVSILYWAFLYNPHPFKFDNFAAHAFNLIVVTLDLIFNAIPVRLIHAVYVMAYATTYVIFTVIYYYVDPVNNSLYKVMLNWNDPVTASIVSIVLILIILPIFQLLIFGIYLLKLFVSEKLSSRTCGKPIG